MRLRNNQASKVEKMWPRSSMQSFKGKHSSTDRVDTLIAREHLKNDTLQAHAARFSSRDMIDHVHSTTSVRQSRKAKRGVNGATMS